MNRMQSKGHWAACGSFGFSRLKVHQHAVFRTEGDERRDFDLLAGNEREAVALGDGRND
jgi:hypothetical protein